MRNRSARIANGSAGRPLPIDVGLHSVGCDELVGDENERRNLLAMDELDGSIHR
jgi:hypothetical protein